MVCCLSLETCPFWTFCGVESYSLWSSMMGFVPIITVPLKSVSAVAGVKNFLPLETILPSSGSMAGNHSTVQMGTFHVCYLRGLWVASLFGAILNSAVVSTLVQISLDICAHCSRAYTYKWNRCKFTAFEKLLGCFNNSMTNFPPH